MFSREYGVNISTIGMATLNYKKEENKMISAAEARKKSTLQSKAKPYME